MTKREIYERLKQNPQNIRFDEICRLAEQFGFVYRGGKGSHRIYAKPGMREFLNFQNARGKAKPYQVRQFVRLIEQYSLMEE